MKSNITMISMSSSGKSAIRVLLAKRPGFSFVDVNIIIQEKEDRLLEEVIAQEGMDGLLKVEEGINIELDVALSVIAPDGSIIHGEKTMEHLKEISEVVHLEMGYEEMERHTGSVVDRGVTLKPGFALRDLCNEHIPYYEKCTNITIDKEGRTPGDTVGALRDTIKGVMDRSIIERIVKEQKKILEERDRKVETYEAEIAAFKEELALLRIAETV